MFFGSRPAWAAVAAVCVLVAASCSDDAADATPVPARPGITQPEPGGATLGEDEACRRLTDAEDARRRTLMCDELVHAPCPIYVRPAGTGCWAYSEDSVRACETVIDGYESCRDFDERKCVLSAVATDGAECGPGGGGHGGGPTSGGTGS